jgi:hypothetical protein
MSMVRTTSSNLPPNLETQTAGANQSRFSRWMMLSIALPEPAVMKLGIV